MTTALAMRLKLIRIAYGNLQDPLRPINQSQFAELCGIKAAAWNNLETGDNGCGIENAISIKRRTGVGLDYIFDGDLADLPHRMAVEIERLQKAQLKRG